MNQDQSLKDNPTDPKDIKNSPNLVFQTDEEDYEVALEWLADFKDSIHVYTGKLSIPNGVFNLRAYNQE